MSSPDLEAQILGCVLDAESAAVNSNAAALLDLSGLSPSDFRDPRTRYAWQIAQRLAQRQKPVDAMTVWATGRATRTFAPDDLSWLQGLAASNSLDSARFVHLVDEVRTAARLKALRAGLLEIVGTLDGTTADMAKVSAQLESMLGALAAADVDDDDASGDVFEIANQWDRQEAGLDPPAYLPTGIELIDATIKGFVPNLNVICGLPSTGKSALLATILDALTADGVRIGLFGLEDGTRWVAERIMARDLGVPLAEVGVVKRVGELGERFADCAQRITNQLRLLTVYRRDSITVAELCRRGRSWRRNRGVRGIFVDHGGEIDHNATHADDFRLKVGESYRLLRNLAIGEAMPVVSLAHTVRPSDDNEERPPRTSELAESANIERRARLMLGVWAKADEPDAVRVSVLKNTRGRRGVHMKLQRHTEAALVARQGGEYISLAAERRAAAVAKKLDSDTMREQLKAAREAQKKAASQASPQRGMFDGEEGKAR